MDAASWNAISHDYSGQILSVFEHDTRNIVTGFIEKLGCQRKTAADIGCGPGNFLPSLAERFKRVEAIDFSSGLLKNAKKKCADAGHDNVRFHKVNLCRKISKLPYAKVDFALCVNALLEPSLAGRLHMWDKLRASVKRGGQMLLVVPAVESALLSYSRLVHWNLDEGVPPATAVKHEFADDDSLTPAQILRQGVIEAGGTHTKHFLKEELQAELPRHGFEMESIEKLEYPWHTEYADPPETMQEPYPWDWVTLAAKVR